MKNNKKTIIIVIVAILILVLLIFIGLKIFKKESVDETQNVLDQDIVAQDIDEDGSEEKEPDTVTSNTTDDGSVVDSVDTVVVNRFVDENGNDMTEEAIQEAKSKIIEAVKKIPVESLGLDVSLDNARFIFTEGITTINHNECFVFSIYVQEGENLVNKGMYAISRDTTIIYKFNPQTVCYELIQI